MLERMCRKSNPHSGSVGLQTCSATLEITLKELSKAKNKSTLQPSYITPQHMPKGLNIVLHRYLSQSTSLHSIYNS